MFQDDEKDDELSFGSAEDDLNVEGAFTEHDGDAYDFTVKGAASAKEPLPLRHERPAGTCWNCPAEIPRRAGFCLQCALHVKIAYGITGAVKEYCGTCKQTGRHTESCVRVLMETSDADPEVTPVLNVAPPPRVRVHPPQPKRAIPVPVAVKPPRRMPQLPHWNARRLAAVGAVAVFATFLGLSKSKAAHEQKLQQGSAAVETAAQQPAGSVKAFEVKGKRLRLAMPAANPAATVVAVRSPAKAKPAPVEVKEEETPATPKEEPVVKEPEKPTTTEFNTEMAVRLKKAEGETVGWLALHEMEPTLLAANYTYDANVCAPDVSAKYEALFDTYLASLDELADVAQRREVATKAKTLGHNLAELKGDKRCEPTLRRDDKGRVKIYTAMARVNVAMTRDFIPRSQLQ